jgi:hypothetical protein
VAQRATESIMVNAAPDVVYEVVIDFLDYTNWVSDLKNITILETDSDGRGLEVEFRAAAFGRSTTYALRYDYGRAPEQLNWSQTRGDITASLHGSTGSSRTAPRPWSPTTSRSSCWCRSQPSSRPGRPNASRPRPCAS